jgi:hypothetical protein
MTFAVSSGSFIFIGIVLLIFVAVALASYSRRGSGISEHPTDGRGEAPRADEPSEVDHDHREQTPMDFGTR